MRLFERLSNGWVLGLTSLAVIRDHPKLMIFPVMSIISLFTVCLTFFGGMALLWGFNFELWAQNTFGETLGYLAVFVFYLINYFVIVFFNVALVFSARQVFLGQEVHMREAINFSASRINSIMQWSFLAATVGVILNMIRERAGIFGKIMVGIIGMVWSIAAYFVVPVIAFENRTPIDAVKRSVQIIKEKWGESVGANFSFGVFIMLGYFALIAAGFMLGFIIHPVAGVVVAFLMAIVLHTVVAAAKTVFLAAIYQHANQEPHGGFNGETLDNVFTKK